MDGLSPLRSRAEGSRSETGGSSSRSPPPCFTTFRFPPDMVVGCQADRGFPCPLFEVAMLFHCFQGICWGRTCVATFDRSDIRGLVTARPVFIAELPLSTGGNLVNLIPWGDRGFSSRGSDPAYALDLCHCFMFTPFTVLWKNRFRLISELF
jgi:hypothetical protein